MAARFELLPIDGDGHCAFTAFRAGAARLTEIGEMPSVEALRNLVVALMRQRIRDVDETNRDLALVSGYEEAMVSGRMWGGVEEIGNLAEHYGVNLTIYDVSGVEEYRQRPNEVPQNISVNLLRHKNHFSLLVPR